MVFEGISLKWCMPTQKHRKHLTPNCIDIQDNIYIFSNVLLDTASQIAHAENGSMFSYNRQLQFCQYTCTELMGKMLRSPWYQSILCAFWISLDMVRVHV